MKAMKLTFSIMLAALLLAPSFLGAQAEKTAPVKKEVNKLKYENIQDQIDPAFGFLADIGGMIDNARVAKDGNSLLAATMLLAYAERISGKKATAVKAEDLLNEVGELAKEQKNAKLAQTVADYWRDAVLGMNNKVKADEYAKLAKDFTAQASTTRGYGWVRVNNESSLFVDIYIDGYYKGRLYSGYYAYYKIWEGNTKLYAEAPYTEPDNYFWGPRYVDLDEDETYTWTLTD